MRCSTLNARYAAVVRDVAAIVRRKQADRAAESLLTLDEYTGVLTAAADCDRQGPACTGLDQPQDVVKGLVEARVSRAVEHLQSAVLKAYPRATDYVGSPTDLARVGDDSLPDVTAWSKRVEVPGLDKLVSEEISGALKTFTGLGLSADLLASITSRLTAAGTTAAQGVTNGVVAARVAIIATVVSAEETARSALGGVRSSCEDPTSLTSSLTGIDKDVTGCFSSHAIRLLTDYDTATAGSSLKHLVGLKRAVLQATVQGFEERLHSVNRQRRLSRKLELESMPGQTLELTLVSGHGFDGSPIGAASCSWVSRGNLFHSVCRGPAIGRVVSSFACDLVVLLFYSLSGLVGRAAAFGGARKSVTRFTATDSLAGTFASST
jgi:hypothetical protein